MQQSVELDGRVVRGRNEKRVPSWNTSKSDPAAGNGRRDSGASGNPKEWVSNLSKIFDFSKLVYKKFDLTICQAL